MHLHLFANNSLTFTAQKIKFSTEDFFSKCDQTRSFLRIWLHLLQKSLTGNFIFCVEFTLTMMVESCVLNNAYLQQV